MKIQEIIKKYHKAENITDVELLFAIEILTPTVELLGALGERYNLTYANLYDILNDLNRFKKARRL